MYFDSVTELECQYDLSLLANNVFTPGPFNIVRWVAFYFSFLIFLFHSSSLSFYQLMKLDLCTPLKIA